MTSDLIEPIHLFADRAAPWSDFVDFSVAVAIFVSIFAAMCFLAGAPMVAFVLVSFMVVTIACNFISTSRHKNVANTPLISIDSEGISTPRYAKIVWADVAGARVFTGRPKVAFVTFWERTPDGRSRKRLICVPQYKVSCPIDSLVELINTRLHEQA